MSRIDDFINIKNSATKNVVYSGERCLVVNDDALRAMKEIPSHCISLILTDPPYHSTKKGNIINDKSFSTDEDFIGWIEKFSVEWKRILRPNGSIFMYCSSAMEAKLEVMLSKYFNVLSHIVWTKPNEPGYDGWKGKMKKESLRQWYPHSERIIFMESADDGNLNRSPFGNFLRKVRSECNLSGHQLTELTGAYGKVNHGGAVSNWESGRNIPSRQQYAEMCDVFRRCGYKEELPDYEDVIRPFEVSSDVQFTDVWTFPSVKAYKGKHPAEKPINMLEHCIKSTTFKHDIVLDCFAGSGSSLVAALRTNRQCIGIEIDKTWSKAIAKRVQSVECEKETMVDPQIIMKESLRQEMAPSLFANMF